MKNDSPLFLLKYYYKYINLDSWNKNGNSCFPHKNNNKLFEYLVGVCLENGRYIEGELKTSENWAFLARFCFLSEEGQFEYQIDFNEDQGDPNLLLYYDSDDQWPSVYKTNKTCEEKEGVLNVRQNQLVNLTARVQPYRELSGCIFVQTLSTIPTYTLLVPTLPPVTKTMKGKVTISPVVTEAVSTASNTDYESSSFSTTEYYTEPSISSKYFTTTVDSSTPINEYETFLPINENEKFLTLTTEDYVTEQVPKSTTNNLHVIKKRSVARTPYNDRFLRKGRTVTCHNARRFRSSRERWWFIAISNCNGSRGINIKYKILMTNGPPGDYWHEHFSADEFYILPVLMAFTVAYSFLLLGIVICTIELKSRQLLHTTYKIFVFSVIIQLFGILFVSSCYLKLAVSGFMAMKMRRFGLILIGMSETSFLLLLLLLAKGYTVTRGRLPIPASIKLTVFMCLYAVTYVSIFIYEAKVFDPGEVLYLYESPAGYALISLRIIAWCMFVYSTIFTLKHYPEKGNFYYPFNIFGTLWFIAGPAFILSANTYIDKWVRESVVFAVLLFLSFGGHLMFLLLTMPSVANKNFPFHVRTTQIGVMEIAGRNGTSTMEQFGHHIYEPTTTIREQTVIIPLTKRTEEIFEGMRNQAAFRKNDYSQEEEESQQELVRDKTTENVLSWSMAKNVAALELPMNHNSSTASANSRSDNNNDSNQESPSLREFNDLPKKISQNYEDYIRDVPIELFTVSKMIVTTTNNIPKHNEPPQ